MRKKIDMAKKISTPELMWQMFEEYVVYTKEHPYVITDYVGKDATPVDRYKEKALIMEGFECFVADKPNMPWSLEDYFSNQDNRYSEFISVCSRIRKAIRQDQIGGGLAGLFNPSITQRLNGLVDKQEVKTIKEQPLFGDDPTEADNGDDLV